MKRVVAIVPRSSVSDGTTSATLSKTGNGCAEYPAKGSMAGIGVRSADGVERGKLGEAGAVEGRVVGAGGLRVRGAVLSPKKRDVRGQSARDLGDGGAPGGGWAPAQDTRGDTEDLLVGVGERHLGCFREVFLGGIGRAGIGEFEHE